MIAHPNSPYLDQPLRTVAEVQAERDKRAAKIDDLYGTDPNWWSFQNIIADAEALARDARALEDALGKTADGIAY